MSDQIGPRGPPVGAGLDADLRSNDGRASPRRLASGRDEQHEHDHHDRGEEDRRREPADQEAERGDQADEHEDDDSDADGDDAVDPVFSHLLSVPDQGAPRLGGS